VVSHIFCFTCKFNSRVLLAGSVIERNFLLNTCVVLSTSQIKSRAGLVFGRGVGGAVYHPLPENLVRGVYPPENFVSERG
jgi:hypothetical protein